VKVTQVLKNTSREVFFNNQDTVAAVNEMTRQQVAELELQRVSIKNKIRLLRYFMCMTEYMHMSLG